MTVSLEYLYLYEFVGCRDFSFTNASFNATNLQIRNFVSVCSQGEKAIEDIKTRVLALTGRFNLSTDANQVQRERLTMFSPTCKSTL